MTTNPSLVAVVGGSDVDARIPLMNQLRDRYSFAVLGSSEELKAKFQSAGYPYFAYPLRGGANPIYDSVTLWHLRKLFRQIKPDVVHTFDTKPSVLGRIAANWAEVPVIIGTLPGLGSLYANDNLKIRVIRAIYEPLQRYACKRSNWTIFQNLDDLHEFKTKRIVDISNSSVILGSGVDTEKFAPEVIESDEIAHLRNRLGIRSDDVVILMISRLIRTKGVLMFAETASNIRSHHPEWRFVLVGPRDDSSLDCLTDNEMDFLKQNVMWLGARQDIPELLAMSDIFVLPSFYREGIPRALLEAAAIGLALITTDSPGCNEVVVDGQNGYVVPRNDSEHLAEAIVDLAQSPDRRAEFGHRSRQRARHTFALDVIARQTDDLYQSLINECQCHEHRGRSYQTGVY